VTSTRTKLIVADVSLVVAAGAALYWLLRPGSRPAIGRTPMALSF